MPELPEVEIVRRGLDRLMTGETLQKVTLRRKDLRTPFPPGMEKSLEGRRVQKVQRRAKYLLLHLSGGRTLLMHLGMSGRVSVVKGKYAPLKHDHVLIRTKSDKQMVFYDPRRFGLMDVLNTIEAPQHKLLRHIGVEPLSKDLSATYLTQKFKGKKAAVKLALLDQRLVAGIGNIYACEALFYAHINPRKHAGKVSARELKRLVPAIRKVLKKSLACGGSSLRDYAHADGNLGRFQHEFAVYDRKGKRCAGCTCDIKKTGGVQAITQGGRTTFFCPVKQK